MFLFVLGGSLVLGAGLLAAASYSDGTVVSVSTAAQSIGWLFLVATVVGVGGLRQATFGRLGAAVVTFLSGVTLLYASYFEPGQVLDAPIRHAAAEPLPAHEPVYKVIDESLVPTVALASVQTVMPVATKEVQRETRLVLEKTVDRCTGKTGWAWIVCQERERLEYCESRQGDEATCPSATAYSPPG